MKNGMMKLAVDQRYNLSVLARRFRVKRSDIEGFVSETPGFDLLVAVRIGNGVGTLEPQDWEVERYE